MPEIRWLSSASGAGVARRPASLPVARGGVDVRDGKVISLISYTIRPRPSKPWGCRSKTLTPTPEPRDTARAMSQENVEIVRRSTRLNRRKEAIFEHSSGTISSSARTGISGVGLRARGVSRFFEARRKSDDIEVARGVLDAGDYRVLVVRGGGPRKRESKSRTAICQLWHLRGRQGWPDERYSGASRGPRSRGAVGARRSRRLLSRFSRLRRALSAGSVWRRPAAMNSTESPRMSQSQTLKPSSIPSTTVRAQIRLKAPTVPQFRTRESDPATAPPRLIQSDSYISGASIARSSRR